MKEVTCNKCGRVHAALSAEEQLRLNLVHDQHYYCHNCGNIYTNFRPAVEADAPAGVTLQPIVECINFYPTKERMKQITDESEKFHRTATEKQLRDFSE